MNQTRSDTYVFDWIQNIPTHISDLRSDDEQITPRFITKISYLLPSAKKIPGLHIPSVLENLIVSYF